MSTIFYVCLVAINVLHLATERGPLAFIVHTERNAIGSRSASTTTTKRKAGEQWQDSSSSTDSNRWRSIDEQLPTRASDEEIDWQDVLSAKEDGTFWSSFEPSNNSTKGGDETNASTLPSSAVLPDEEVAVESWLDTLKSLTADEVEFNIKEADRAEKARQMMDWGFEAETIKNTLGVATDTSLEVADEVVGMQSYREQAFLDGADLELVESHSRVEVDDVTGEPVRTQMVYVDEHTCIGCTNCKSL
jgi:hypothetical protein